MIVPDLVLRDYANLRCSAYGLDTVDKCVDVAHFKSYPHSISYSFNSRGFRDEEWPIDTRNAIWCFGDSFTVGLGSPIEHTWVNILQEKTGTRCINVSMDGASNDWIARRADQVVREVGPKNIVIHWSYLNRSEYPVGGTSDESRRICYDRDTLLDPAELFRKFELTVTTLLSSNSSTSYILSVIPDFSWVLSPDLHSKKFTLLNSSDTIPEFKILDYARDGHHYGVKTATEFVNSIIPRLQA